MLAHSRQEHYAWLAAPIRQRGSDDAYLTDALIDAHGDDPELGYRFLADELDRAGRAVVERRAGWPCSQPELWSATVRRGRCGSGANPGPAVHGDPVQRGCTAEACDTGVGTDIAEQSTAEGKLYCCAIEDLFSIRIVG